jgi:hypothetical protein
MTYSTEKGMIFRLMFSNSNLPKPLFEGRVTNAPVNGLETKKVSNEMRVADQLGQMRSATFEKNLSIISKSILEAS